MYAEHEHWQRVQAGLQNYNHIPSFDGDMRSWKEFEKRIAIHKMTDHGPPERRVLKVMSKRTVSAWEAFVELALEDLMNAEGLEELMAHLKKAVKQMEELERDLERVLRARSSCPR